MYVCIGQGRVHLQVELRRAAVLLRVERIEPGQRQAGRVHALLLLPGQLRHRAARR